MANADATLVNAAYKMGMANVPVDTSKIFRQQYEALAGIEVAKLEMYSGIVEGVGELAETGIKTYAKIKDAEQRKEWDANYDQLSADYLSMNAEGWANHKNKTDEGTRDEAQARLEAIKEEINTLREGARTPEQRKKLSKLNQAVFSWRDENNELLAVGQVHMDNWSNRRVDKNNSFIDPLTKKQSPLMMTLYNQVMDPGVDIRDANIKVQYRSGQRGYLFNTNDDRLALTYKLLKDKEKVDIVDAGEKADANIPETSQGWISHEELMGMVKLKDTALVTDLGGVMTQSLASANEQLAAPPTLNADGITYTKSKNMVYAKNDYKSEMSAQNEKAYFDILMSRTTSDAKGNQSPRDPYAGIDYINNNKILVGNTEVDYREHSKSNPMIASASYADLGLTGSVDEDGNQIIDSDELTDKDRTAIHDLLMNPKTPEQYEIAAREIARYFDLQTEAKFNADRANPIKTPTTTATTTSTTTSPTTTSEVGNFDHINKGQYIPLAGVSVQKGSLENIRTAIKSRTPGGFYLGPKGDEKAFVPVGDNKWEMRDSDGKVLATYNGVSQLIKSGLKTSDKGFRSLITMDIDSDSTPDGPVSLDFLNKKYYDLIDTE